MSEALQYLAVIFVIAVILDLYLVSGWRKYRTLRQEREKAGEPVYKLQLFKQAFTADRKSRWNQFIQRAPSNTRLRDSVRVLLELGLLAVWTMIVCWDYLDMDPRIVPSGREFGSAIQSNHLWTQFRECGWCAVWNGFERGGYPAFADIQGSMLHPITMISTLGWGVVNGVKISLILSFWLAGVAQWWIARELQIGWLPRLWSAGIAIAGGHLAGRMQLGVPGVVLSTAMTSLMFAALIRLARTGTCRDAILLGILAASAIVSGQGYIQIGLLGILPVFVLFFIDKGKWKTYAGWKNYLLAAGIAFLLSAPLLLPLAHFSPNIAKYMDPEFKSVQPLSYFVLNLVIDDAGYFNSDVMGKFPYPYLYTLYIGWIPILLAIFALNKAAPEHRKLIWFMTAGIVVEFLIASGIALKWLMKILPAVAGVRHPPQIAGLAIPFILGLSAYGLDKLFKLRLPDLSLNYAGENTQKWGIPPRWILIIPLVFSLQSCLRFAQHWLNTEYITDDVYKSLALLKTEDMQWVEPPFGEHFYIEPAISMGMKLSPGITTWVWKNRTDPDAILYAAHHGAPEGDVRKLGVFFGLTYYVRNNVSYAGVVTDDKIQPCKALGSGGLIQVTCDVATAGNLVVQENMWSGWQAWMDGERVQLVGRERLEITTAEGKHTFEFRYLPWDVPLGLALFLIGIIISVRLWFLPESKTD
jgi:hypothetical protein